MADDTLKEDPVLRFDAILDLALVNGIIDEEQALSIQDEHDNSGKPIRELIVTLGYIPEDDLLGVLAGYMCTDIISFANISISQDVRNAIPAAIAYQVYSKKSDDLYERFHGC